ncbi:MAG: DinB family protein [Caldilineaceae bacterium]
MSERNDVVATLRAHLKGAHEWLEGTLEGVTNEMANSAPKGVVATIGAQYAHVVTFEDYFFNGLLKGGAPIMMSENAGVSSPPPMGPWSDWGRSVKVSTDDQRAYAQKVYAATDAYLATLTDADLSREFEAPFAKLPIGEFVRVIILNAHVHAGEISCLKGLQGEKGYPI